MISLEMTSLKDTKLVTLALPSFWESPYTQTPVILLSFSSDDLQINHKKQDSMNSIVSSVTCTPVIHLDFYWKKRSRPASSPILLSLFFWSKGVKGKRFIVSCKSRNTQESSFKTNDFPLFHFWQPCQVQVYFLNSDLMNFSRQNNFSTQVQKIVIIRQ